jgi:aspartate-semialdehyde dehydrogenase
VSAARGLRVAVAGATGALGGELIEVIEERRFPAINLLALASERSLGETVELRGDVFDVESGARSLRSLDLLFLCAPPPASLEWARLALRESVPCIDLSGALAGAPDVPLLAAELAPSAEALRAPILAAPAGPALAWAIALAPLARGAGLVRVVGTALESASSGGRRGIESLSAESIALFSQQDLPDPTVFERPVAFDCVPALGEAATEGSTPHEDALARDLERLLGAGLRIGATTLRVPTFVGTGASLAVETREPLSPSEACALLAKAPGVELVDPALSVPTTRTAAGRDVVLAGRVRRDPSCERGLLLWLAADALRLAAVNGVKLAEARLASS